MYHGNIKKTHKIIRIHALAPMAILLNPVEVMLWMSNYIPQKIMVFTRDSEVIMFSPGVTVCICLFVVYGVFLDDLTKKDWCHRNKIRYAPMTSMTSLCQKVGKIWNCHNSGIFIIQRGNKYCHKLWLTSHLPDTLKLQFDFGFWKLVRGRMWKPFSGVLKNVVYMIASMWLKYDIYVI